MKRKIGLYFQLETDGTQGSYSVIKQALHYLELLEKEGLNVKYFELRLKEIKQKCEDFFMKLDGEGGTFIENEGFPKCEQAIENAFSRIHYNLKSQNSSSMNIRNRDIPLIPPERVPFVSEKRGPLQDDDSL